MLKRCQVLLANWQTNFLKIISERYDFSFSEATRLMLSIGYLFSVSAVYPKYKHKVNKKLLDKLTNLNTTEEERYNILSTIYFEARKAGEFRLANVKKQGKVKP